MAACQRALALSPDPLNTALAVGWLGYAYLEQEDGAQAIPRLEQALQLLAQFAFPQPQAWFLAFLAWVFTVFVAGSLDRVFLRVGIDYEGQIWVMRVLNFALPMVVFFVARRVCRRLAARDEHPLRDWDGTVVRRRPPTVF